jgi:hypothetical protein
MNAILISSRSFSIASFTVISGGNMAYVGSMKFPIVPASNDLLRSHWRASSGVAQVMIA